MNNTCFLSIKKKIQILVISLNFITFAIITAITNDKKENYIEYTNLSKLFSNFYIILILLIILIHSISPKFICSLISDNLSILTNDIGKLIINLLIGILYWSSNNTTHLVFAIINFVSSFGLFLCEFIFQCRILNNNHIDFGSNEDKKNNKIKDCNSSYSNINITINQ